MPTTSTILIVDDTPTNIQVLFDLLDKSGYQVAIAKSGEAALKCLQRNTPDLILLDVMMPGGMDGFETCRQIKALPGTGDVPIIFMTALSDSVNRIKGLHLGAVDYITKPIQHEEVLARMNVHLQLYHLKQNLEQQVASRTAALHQALNDLKNTQVQLVHGEKMSSLGQLVAGIAHEINNPVNFIYGNLKPAQDYIRDLLELVDLLCAENPNLSPKIQDHIEEIDLDFLRTDLPRLLQSMTVGTQRIRDLVLSLRNFSRLDESGTKAVDIHEGVESTLLILHNRFKAKAGTVEFTIEKDYGDLPLVECYPSQLNQVLMNVLSNSLDALDEAIARQLLPPDQPPQIRIQTNRIDGDRIRIGITDNGPGIDEALQGKIFDAFFTTKPINKGTGLGLSISYQIIVDKHQGSLRCYSTPGQGTTIEIELPIFIAHNSETPLAHSHAQPVA